MFGLTNGSTRFIWGWLLDKFNFKILMYIITYTEIIVSTSLFYLVKYPSLYICANLIIACCLSGTFTIITPVFNKIFGKEKGTEMYGMTGFFIGVASFSGPVIAKILINDKKDYLKIYLVGSFVCLIKLFVLFSFDENEKFEFKQKENIEPNKNYELGSFKSNDDELKIK